MTGIYAYVICMSKDGVKLKNCFGVAGAKLANIMKDDDEIKREILKDMIERRDLLNIGITKLEYELAHPLPLIDSRMNSLPRPLWQLHHPPPGREIRL